ncbi:Mobile element protein [Pseudomonas floridensis]
MTMLRGTRIVTGQEAATFRQTENLFRSYLHRSRC